MVALDRPFRPRAEEGNVMNLIAKLATAAAFAGLAATALPSQAEAQRHSHGHSSRSWSGPEGHFIVYRRSCPDLIEDRIDRRVNYGRRDRREDRRDRRVLDCPDNAWEYVPSRRELRAGRTGERLRPGIAYLDRRTRSYHAETRWGDVPVYVVRGRHPDERRRGYRGRDRRAHTRY